VVKPTGFMEYDREEPAHRPVTERVGDYREIEELLPEEGIYRQAARCMDCGIPYCHAYGCPVKNRIPDWNDMVYRKNWRKALDLLHATCNLPEITGRVCPAPCEAACTLAINLPAVTIRHLELQIVEHGWREEWIRPEPAAFRPASASPSWGRPGGAPRRPAARALRTRGRGLREVGPDRRAPAVRHPRLQAREVGHRPPARPAAGRGGSLRDERQRRGGRLRGVPSPFLRRDRPGRRATAARDLPAPGRDLKGSTSRWSSSRNRTVEMRGTRSSRGKRSPQRGSTWW